MSVELIHRFERGGRRFAIDPESCFCFECDLVSWDVLEHYPLLTVNHICHLLSAKHPRKELEEVIGELEWLRATKSILTVPNQKDLVKKFEIERGVKRLTVFLAASPRDDAASGGRRWWRKEPVPGPRDRGSIAESAVRLLVARAGAQKDLYVEFVAQETIPEPAELANLVQQARGEARIARKQLTVAVALNEPEIGRLPEPAQHHSYRIVLEFGAEFEKDVRPFIEKLAKLHGKSLSHYQAALYPDEKHLSGRIVIRPNRTDFDDAIRRLDEADFSVIELDLDGMFTAQREIAPAEMLGSMQRTMEYYVEKILARRYFRLDPLAGFFQRIYTGKPVPRSDPAGTHELAVSASGDIYPSAGFIALDAQRAGAVTGDIDEALLYRFDDVGALTTAPCIRCWASHLCGGGPAAVHEALTGDFRRPRPEWCDFQREWMAGAIASFHQLSSAGIHFDRVYKMLGRREKPSLFLMARTALTVHIGARPIEEADAPLLTQWENWNDAAYFLFSETGMLLATRYDREMESLYPRGVTQELVLLRRDGSPFGLLKFRPDRIPGLATAWIYFKDDSDYQSDTIRKSFRTVLDEAGDRQNLRHVIIPAAAYETGLRVFLKGIGFEEAGTRREAIYLHGKYHDVVMYKSRAN